MAIRGRWSRWPAWLTRRPNQRQANVAAAAMLSAAAGAGLVASGDASWPSLFAVVAFTALGTVLVNGGGESLPRPVAVVTPARPALVADPGPELPKPRMLPERQEVFRGRADELARLLHHHDTGRAQREAHLRTAPDDPGAAGARLIMLHGRPGVGKTALADEFAHRIADQYPDGQLYAKLGSAGRARPPGEILKVLLAALGRNNLPKRAEDRLKLFRSLLAERRILLVLDAARNADQVRQLLPTAPGCTVIVTSRRDVGASLSTRAMSMLVDVPSAVEAADILRTFARTSPSEDPVCTAEIVHLVGRLPLALRIAGERAANGPQRLCGMARTLRDEQGRLAQLQFRGNDVRRRIAGEYQRLTDQEQEAFRLLALVEPATFQPWALASLMRVEVTEAENLVAQLCAARLVDVAYQDSSGPARYRFHPLVRLYARELLAERVPAVDQRAARDRLHEFHLQAVRKSGEAVGYVAAEYASLVDAIDTAAAQSDWATCWWIGSLLGDCVPYDVDPDRCLRAFKTCADAAARQDEAPARVAVAVARGSYLISIERYDEGIATLEEVTRQLDPDERVRPLVIGAHRRIAEAYLQAAAYAKARAFLDRTVRLIKGMPGAQTDPQLGTELAMINVLRAEMLAATDATRWQIDRPYQDLQAANDDRVRYRIQVNLADVASRRRDWSAALDHLRLASLAERANARRAASVAYRTARAKLAAARHLDGEDRHQLLQEAADLAADAVLTFRRIHNAVGEVRARCMLARALILDRQPEAAGEQIRVAKQALLGLRGATCAIGPLDARINRAEGEMLIEQGSYNAAIGVLRRAEQLFRESWDVLSRAETHRLLGRAYLRADQPHEALDALWSAAEEYRRGADLDTFGEICEEMRSAASGGRGRAPRT